MWEISYEENREIWTSNKCLLDILYNGDERFVYINYRGYNIALVMGMWGFEEEIQTRGICCSIEGKNGIFRSLYYKVKKENLKLFCDLVYFFVVEHNFDSALFNELKL